MDILATRLKWLREEKRYGQKEVASKIGITPSGYQKMEYGESNPKIDTLINIAEFYGETTDFLLGLSDYNSNLVDLDRRLLVISKEVEYLREEYMNYHFRLEGIVDKDLKDKITDELRTAEFDFKTTLSTFIDLFYYIPDSKPEADKWISKHLPLRIEVSDMNLIGVHNVLLVSNKGEELDILYSNIDRENAESKVKDYEKYYRIIK